MTMQELHCSTCGTKPKVVEHDGEVIAACECMTGVPFASTEDPQPIVQEWLGSPDDS